MKWQLNSLELYSPSKNAWKCTVYYDSLHTSCCCIYALLWRIFSVYYFTSCHPTCCLANRSAFSSSLAGQTLSGNLLSARLANAYLDCQKLDTIICEPCSHYASASVPKWPWNKLESIKFVKNFLGKHGLMQTCRHPSLPCLCMHTYTYHTK